MLIVVMLINIGLINKKTNQEKELEKISKAYEASNDEMAEAYNNSFDESEYVKKSDLDKYIEEATTYMPGDTYKTEQSINTAGFVTDARKKLSYGNISR